MSHCLPKVIRLLLVELQWSVLTFTQFQGPNDVGIGAPCIVVFIPEWPRLAGNKHKPGAGVFVEPLAHRFIDAIDPTWDKIGGHVFVPFVKHLTHFLTEFRQPIQVQSHLEMPGILVQLGCIQCT